MNATRHHPRFSLGLFPTPLHRAMRLREDASLLLKRDDLTGLATGGNKVRKLEFLMAEALARGCNHVITMGAFSLLFLFFVPFFEP